MIHVTPALVCPPFTFEHTMGLRTMTKIKFEENFTCTELPIWFNYVLK